MSTKTRLEILERGGAKALAKRAERESQEVRAYLATLTDAELGALQVEAEAREKTPAEVEAMLDEAAPGYTKPLSAMSDAELDAAAKG